MLAVSQWYACVQQGPFTLSSAAPLAAVLPCSLWTTMCLVYAPEKIAATCLFLAHEIHGLPLPGVDPAAPPTPRAEEQPDPNSDRRFFCQTFNIMDQELEGEWRCSTERVGWLRG